MYLDPFQTNLYLFYCCFLFEIMEITIDLGIYRHWVLMEKKSLQHLLQKIHFVMEYLFSALQGSK